MVNTELAQQVLDYIIENPEQHEQEYFVARWDGNGEYIFPDDSFTSCSTTMCVAGTAVALIEGIDSLFIDHPRIEVAARATEYLGLDPDDADNLFYCMNNSAAVDAVGALAQGDLDKFRDVLNNVD